MAKADYIVSLIKSHYNNEPERFTTMALQIAAHEAKLGHTLVANEIKTIIDKAKEAKHKSKSFAPDLQGLILENVPAVNLADMIASEDIKSKITRIISEFVQRDKLRKHDLENRRKISFRSSWNRQNLNGFNYSQRIEPASLHYFNG